MGLQIRKKIRLLRTPLGRRDIRHKILNQFYPLTRPLAGLYRRTVLRRVKVISVIGSLGKSSTCRTIAAAVGDNRLEGYANYKNSIIRNLLKHGPSSPYAVLETAVGGPGYMAGYSTMLDPDYVVVTSIASEHILTFKSIERIREEKADMLRRLPEDRIVILNADDPNVMWMASRTEAKKITCSIDAEADIRASNIRIRPPDGMEFDVSVFSESHHLRISMLGRHMIFPVLSALAVAALEGRDLSATCRVLEGLKPVEARMHSITLPSRAVLIRDDYKSTRESVWRALETLREYPARRKFLVLGGVSEIFNEERYAFYRNLGHMIGEIADYAYLFLQRNSFRKCRVGAEERGMNPGQLSRLTGDPVSIVSLLPEDLGEGDVLLIKGRSEYKISRLSLALMGRKVRCRLMSCSVTTSFCDNCSMLERGWGDKP